MADRPDQVYHRFRRYTPIRVNAPSGSCRARCPLQACLGPLTNILVNHGHSTATTLRSAAARWGVDPEGGVSSETVIHLVWAVTHPCGPAEATQEARVQGARARAPRFSFLRKHGGAVAGVVRGGPKASVTFGAAVQGATNAALARMRTAVGACAFGNLGGSSLTLRFLISDAKDLDPAIDMTIRPLTAWAQAIWNAEPGLLRKMAVVHQAAAASLQQGADLEKLAPGPARVVLLALRRIGWVAEDVRTWVTDRGVRLDLGKVCPRSVVVLARLGVERWQWQHVMAQYQDEFVGFERGGDLQPIRKFLGRRSPLSAPQRQLLKCAFTRRLWPDYRRAEAGYQASGACAACGEEAGTIRHVLYRCPALAMARHCQDLGAVGRCGARSAAEHHLFTRGVMPYTRHLAPPPVRAREVHWDTTCRQCHFEGHAFLDGSRFEGQDLLLARAGWGVACVRVVGKVEACAWGPYPGVIQCIDAAEVFAALMALTFGVPPLVLYSDSDFFVLGWKRGRAWCTAGGRAHAEVWRDFWNLAEEFGGSAAIKVVKVRGHATAAMVERGEVSEVDRFGNDAADAAAKRGARCHPSVQAVAKAQEASRLVCSSALAWLGIGLEQAQLVGSMPLALTQTDKASRPRKGSKLHLDVVADDQWRRETRAATVCARTHPSHDLRRSGTFFFCAVCGLHAGRKMVKLVQPCLRELLPSRKHKRDRLLRGQDPRTGLQLPDAAGCVRASALPPLTVSVRR